MFFFGAICVFVFDSSPVLLLLYCILSVGFGDLDIFSFTGCSFRYCMLYVIFDPVSCFGVFCNLLLVLEIFACVFLYVVCLVAYLPAALRLFAHLLRRFGIAG